MTFRINVKTVSNNVLKFKKVETYEVIKGDFLKFIDTKTREVKRFHSSNCDIEEEIEIVEEVEEE